MEQKINNLIEMIERYERPSATFPYEDSEFKQVDQHSIKDGRVVINMKDNKIQVQYITNKEDIYCVDYNDHILLGCNKESTEVREQTLRKIVDENLFDNEPFVSVEYEMRVFKLIVVINNYLLYKRVYDK